MEMRIAKLEDTIANARVIDESKIDKSKVQILSKVTLLNHNTHKQMTYTIVAEHEANLREGKLAIGADRQGAAGPQEGRLRGCGRTCRHDPLRDPQTSASEAPGFREGAHGPSPAAGDRTDIQPTNV